MMKRIPLIAFISVNSIVIISTIILLLNAINNGENKYMYYFSQFNIFQGIATGLYYYGVSLFFWGGITIFMFKLSENIIDSLIYIETKENIKVSIIKISLCILFLLSVVSLSLIFLLFPYYRKITDSLSKLLFFLFWIIQGILAFIYNIILKRIER